MKYLFKEKDFEVIVTIEEGLSFLGSSYVRVFRIVKNILGKNQFTIGERTLVETSILIPLIEPDDILKTIL